METAPSEAFEGAAEDIVEVDIDEKELVGYLEVVAGEDVTTPSELKENKSSSQVPVGDYDHPEYPA